MTRTRRNARDPLTAAAITTVWAIIGNKPLYPLYVWWLIGRDAAVFSLWTLVAMPLFVALPFVSSRSAAGARLGLVAAGIADTGFASLMFGAGTGAIYFVFPCLMLAALSFTPAERWRSRGLVATAFLLFAIVASADFRGVHLWSVDEAKTLSALNLYCAIALSAFIALRFSGVSCSDGATPLDA